MHSVPEINTLVWRPRGDLSPLPSPHARLPFPSHPSQHVGARCNSGHGHTRSSGKVTDARRGAAGFSLNECHPVPPRLQRDERAEMKRPSPPL